MKFNLINKLDLKHAISQYLLLIHNWSYCKWTEENFLYDLPKKWDFSFSLSEDDTIKAFCFASNKIPDVYYIHLLFVSNQLRGKSIGKKMIAQAKEIANKNNINKIELRCPESNKKALAFYSKNGFDIKEKIKDETSGNEADYYLVNTF